MTKEESAIITKYDLYFESRLSKAECGIEELKQDFKDIKSEFKDMRRLLYTIMGVGFTSIILPIVLHHYGLK